MELLNDVKQRVEAGTAKECMATRGLKDQASLGFSDVQLAFALSAPFSAGIDTVSLCTQSRACSHPPPRVVRC